MSLSTPQKRPVRRRRQPQEAREEALASARQLLLKGGPQAVTLKAVADDLGMTHTNLLHHFGSAAELQAALMATMVDDLDTALRDAVGEFRACETRSEPEKVQAFVDKVFDAYGRGGAGRLAAWLSLTDNFTHFEKAEEVTSRLVAAIEEKFCCEEGVTHKPVTSAVLLLTLCAFADSLVGGSLTEMLHRERGAARKLAAALLPLLF